MTHWLQAAHSVDAVLSVPINNRWSAALRAVQARYRQKATVSRRDKLCLSAFGAEVAEPAQRATELARRRGLQGH